ncbi:MAG TPA: hypothetical protein VLE89_04715 [Chlamydiales bacterium]|nr:hypothetical protein [Chlamydiales bacterium]
MTIQFYTMGMGFNQAIDPEQGICLHKWVVDDKEIELLQVGAQLAYQVFDQATNKTWSAEIPRNERTLEEQILDLKACETVLNFDGSVDFSQPLFKYPTPDDREITLLHSSGDLIWQLFDRVTQMSTQITCYFNRERQLLDRISSIQNSRVESFVAAGNQLQSVALAPISHASLLDLEEQVDGDTWAVTLITCDTSGLYAPYGSAGHAAIIAEGIEAGSYFMKKGHLTPGKEYGSYQLGKVSVHDLQPFYKGNELWFRYVDRDTEEIKECKVYDRKSETWLRTSYTVRKMLDAILEEHEGHNPCLFHRRGAGAMNVHRKVYVNGVRIEGPPVDIGTPFKYIHAVSNDFVNHLPLIGKTWRKKDSVEEERSKTRTLADERLFHHSIELSRTYGAENVSVIEPENCITWARKKLSIAGIETSEGPVARIFVKPARLLTIPKLFTKLK